MYELKYERLNKSHSKELIFIWADVDVIRYTNIKKACTFSEIREKIAVLEPFDTFAVKDGESIIGIVGCPKTCESEYGIFYQFKSAVWGSGIATKAIRWLLDYMKDKYGSLVIVADVVAENIASEKILIHCGFKYEYTSENAFVRDGKYYSVKRYRKVINNI